MTIENSNTEPFDLRNLPPVRPDQNPDILDALDADRHTEDQITMLQEAAAKITPSISYEFEDGKRKAKVNYIYIDPDRGEPQFVDPTVAQQILEFKPKIEDLPIHKNAFTDLSSTQVEQPVEITRDEWGEIFSRVNKAESMSPEYLHLKMGLDPQLAVAVFRELQSRGIVAQVYTKGRGYLVNPVPETRPQPEPGMRSRVARHLGKTVTSPVKQQWSEMIDVTANRAVKLSGATLMRDRRAKEANHQQAVREYEERQAAQSPPGASGLLNFVETRTTPSPTNAPTQIQNPSKPHIPEQQKTEEEQQRQRIENLIRDPNNAHYFSPNWLRELDGRAIEPEIKRIEGEERGKFTTTVMPPRAHQAMEEKLHRTRLRVIREILESDPSGGDIVSDDLVLAIETMRQRMRSQQRQQARRSGQSNRP